VHVLGFAGKGVHEKVGRKLTKGGVLFKGNASPTVPGAFELEDRKQALLLCACPRLLQEKVCTKKVQWAGFAAELVSRI
jgi:hypothetical protein